MQTVPIKPLFARVLLKREKPEKIGSIFIPTDAAKRNAPLRGVAVATGPTCAPTIHVGRTYLLGQYAGAWVNEKGQVVPAGDDAEFFIVQDEDLLAEVVSDE